MNIADEYLKSRVMTARPEELHLMVVDGAVRQAVRAEEALPKKHYETSHEALNRARDFVIELIAGLDDKQAPDLVEKLKGLFGFVYRRLNEADLYHDVEKVREALQVLRMHRETWQQLLALRREAGRGEDTGR